MPSLSRSGLVSIGFQGEFIHQLYYEDLGTLSKQLEYVYIGVPYCKRVQALGDMLEQGLPSGGDGAMIV